MACLITTGRLVECGAVIGGIKEVYFQSNIDMPASTGYAQAGGIISNWGDGLTNEVFSYVLKPEQSTMSITINSDRDTGGYFFEQSLTVMLHNVQPADFDAILEMINAAPNVFVLDNNDRVYVLGAEYGMYVTGGMLESGTAYTDKFDLEIQLTAKELNLTYEITQSAGVGTANYPFDNVASTVTVTPGT